MDVLAKKNQFNKLYDQYGVLLTAKQRCYFESYYFDDLSLAEIASLNAISRNAVYDQLQKIYKILEELESKLHLVEKNNLINEICLKYQNIENENVQNIIKELKRME